VRARGEERVHLVMNRFAAIAISSRCGKPSGDITNYAKNFDCTTRQFYGGCVYIPKGAMVVPRPAHARLMNARRILAAKNAN